MNKNDRVGETKTYKNGQTLKIIEYYNNRNITVQFDDGTILKNKRYESFKNEEIKNPNYRIGETAIYKDGRVMKIVAYRSNLDLDVQFDNGEILAHKRYDWFIKNYDVKNPKSYNTLSIQTSFNELVCQYYFESLGFKKYAKEYYTSIGLKNMEYDLYSPTLKVAIEYDGYWHKNKKDSDIQKNLLSKELGIRLIRIREKNLPILTNCETYNISNVKHFNDELLNIIRTIYQKLVLEYKINNIFAFNKNKDFENIRNMYCDKIKDKSHLNETNIAKNGQKMTIIRYISTTNMDIQFEDGTIVFCNKYESFEKGYVRNPNKPAKRSKVNKELRLGQENIANNGLKMKIIKYRSFDDIDVLFENNIVVRHRRYYNFQKGNIGTNRGEKIS